VGAPPADPPPVLGPGPGPDRGPGPALASGPGPAAPVLAVLLAEHEPEVAEMARRYLTRAGAAVTITTGADETTAALIAQTADVAVLDLTMPGLDARRLRRLIIDQQTPRQSPQIPQQPPQSPRQSPQKSQHPPQSPQRAPQKPQQPPQQPQQAQQAQQAQQTPQSPSAPRSQKTQETLHSQDARSPQETLPARLPALFLLSPSMRPRDLRIAAESCLYRPFSPRLLVSRVLAVAPRPAARPPAAPRPVTLGPALHSAPASPASPPAAPRPEPVSPDQPAPPTPAPTSSPTHTASPTRIPIPTGPLTPTESALLSALADHPGHVLSRSRLQAIVGRSTPGHPASGRAIDVHVSSLRAKLPDPGLIRTVRGVGYILDRVSPTANEPGQTLDDPGQSGSDPPGGPGG
jgi:DNA-binding response OmpR family regulator